MYWYYIDVVLTTIYRLIKDNAALSGRGVVKQWPYFAAMDDLFAGDPTAMPLVVESTIPMGVLQLINLLLTSSEK